jgi:hypothetical protein
MSDPSDRLTSAKPEDLADALAFALRFDGRKRKRDSGKITAAIVARRLVEHLERAGFVVMKKPPAADAGTRTFRAIGLIAVSRPVSVVSDVPVRRRPLRRAAKFVGGTCATRVRDELLQVYSLRSWLQ